MRWVSQGGEWTLGVREEAPSHSAVSRLLLLLLLRPVVCPVLCASSPAVTCSPHCCVSCRGGSRTAAQSGCALLRAVEVEADFCCAVMCTGKSA
jgi:hypothetical protein